VAYSISDPVETIRLSVRVLADGKTVAILVSGLSTTGVERLGQHLQTIAYRHRAALEHRDLRAPAHKPAEFSGFADAWLLTDGLSEQLHALIGELIDFSLPDAGR
jgi:hypothetical protein